MNNNLLQVLLTDSSDRAKLYAQGLAVFAAIYHAVFMAVFYFNGVMPGDNTEYHFKAKEIGFNPVGEVKLTIKFAARKNSYKKPKPFFSNSEN